MREWRLIAIGLLLIAIWPLVMHDVFYQRIGALVLLAAISASAWNLIGGYAGQVSVGHAVYFGAGAYSALVMYTQFGWPPIAGAPVGILVACALAVVVGTPTSRLLGHYFSMATIAVAELIRILCANWPLVGAAVGLMGPPRPRTLADLSFISPVPYFYLFFAVLLVLLALTRHMQRSRMGYYLAAIRGGDRAARSLGVPVLRYKLLALLLSAAFTSIAGTLYAVMVGFVDPDSALGILISVKMIIIAALGGSGTLFGPLIGAIILIPLEETTNAAFGGSGTGITFIVYGAIIVLIARFEPGGITELGIASRHEVCAVLLEARAITKTFGAFRAVDCADLAVTEGEIVGLIGPNGAGKTTFFNCLAGDMQATEGTIHFQGKDVTRAPPEAHAMLGMARTFQVPVTFEEMSVSDNVMVGAFLRHHDRRDARRVAEEVITFTGLAPFAASRAGSLGTPGRKRLEIARALATEPRLLLLDEALAGLTPAEVRVAIELVRRIRDRGITIVIVEHIIEVILPFAHRAVVLHQGKVIAHGAPREVVDVPAVVSAYLGHHMRRVRQ